MNMTSILAMLKGIAPMLEPLGEQGVNQLWVTLDQEIQKLSSPDLKDVAMILSPALKQCVLMELKKLK